MINRIKIIKLFRHFIQAISFFLLPGFYIMAFSEIKDIFKIILSGSKDYSVVLYGSMELAAVVVTTILLGRFFCGWFCAFGAYNDFIHEISEKIFKIKFRLNENLDRMLKCLKYIVLAVIVILVWGMGSTVFNGASPWDAFAQISDFAGVLSSYTLGVLLLILITIGAVLVERFFCRYLCPLGALFNILSGISAFKIDMPKNKCGNCKACTRNCSMGISLHEKNEAKGGECINCLKCIEICPRKNAKPFILNRGVNPVLAALIAVCVCVSLYAINYSSASLAQASTIASQTDEAVTSSADRIYSSNEDTGSTAPTENPTSQANKEAESNSIKDKNSSSANNGLTSGNNGKSSVAGSNNNSVSKSTTNKSQTADASQEKSTINSNTSKESSSVKKYKDGTYIGSGTGFRGGTTKVSVTITNGRISEIKTISTQDTPRFYQRVAGTIINEITASQSTGVDTISGATFSSYGIMDAVQDALNKASTGN